MIRSDICAFINMANINLTNGEVVILFEEVPTNSSEWKTTQTEDYQPDRELFVYNAFIRDYPDLPLPRDQEAAIITIYSLCSRSSALGSWLKNINSSYAAEAVLPRYIEGIVSPETFSKAQKTLTQISKIQADKSRRELLANEKYKKEMADIEKNFENETSKLTGDKIIRILNVKSTELPLTLQLAIENFTPSEDANAPDRRTYAREVLLRYRISLFQYLQRNPSANIAEVIEGMRLK